MASMNEAFNLPLNGKPHMENLSDTYYPMRGSYKTYINNYDSYKRKIVDSELKLYQLKEQ